MRSSLTAFEPLPAQRESQMQLHFQETCRRLVAINGGRCSANQNQSQCIVACTERQSAPASENKALLLTSGLNLNLNVGVSVQVLMSVLVALYALIFWILSPFQAPSRLFLRSDSSGKPVVRVCISPRNDANAESEDVRERRSLAVQNRGSENSAWNYSFFVSGRGKTLFTQSWTPKSKAPKAVVILLHGLNEHSGRYAQFAEQLNIHGYKVYGMDWIGHGGSDGLHGYVPSMEEVVLNTKEFVSKVRSENAGLPYFLFGHSTGGSLVLKSALDTEIEATVKGVIATSPAVRVSPLNPFVAALAPIIAILFPRYQCTAANKEGSVVSRDPKVLEEKYSDPLVYTGAIRVRTGYELLRICSFLQQNIEKITYPVLVLHGEDDTITDPEGSLEVHRRASSLHKDIRLYKGLLHDLLFEPEKNEIIGDIIAWLDGRLYAADKC